MSKWHFSTTYPDILRPAFASSSKTIAIFERNRPPHCWGQRVAHVWPPCWDMQRTKNWTNAHVQAQHCCTNLPKRLQHPQMLHEKFDHFQIRANKTQHVATCRNGVVMQTRATCCAQQCCDMMRWDPVEILLSFCQGFKYGPLQATLKVGMTERQNGG